MLILSETLNEKEIIWLEKKKQEEEESNYKKIPLDYYGNSRVYLTFRKILNV